MTFHKSAFGSFGGSLPANVEGYVTCSNRRVRAIVKAIESGRPVPRWAETGDNLAVARAEVALNAWRRA